MKCPRCQVDAPSDAEFCPQCGAKLVVARSQCGTGNAPQRRFCKKCGQPLAPPNSHGPGTTPRLAPDVYTPRHLAERILTSRAALEGECKQVTVLFADLKSSMELLADRDPEEARKLLDPLLEHMMEAVHHPEGPVNSASSPGARASASRRRSTSPPRQRCSARWA
jgi:double zinc ribbon protein